LAKAIDGRVNNHRPVGSRNKKDAELLDRLEKRGDRPAVDLLSEVANNTNEAMPLRIQAMTALAPFQTAKLGRIPAPAPLVFVANPIALPYPKPLEIRHTLANIARLSAAWRRGDLDQATFEAAIAEQRIVRDGLIEQAKLELELARGGPRESTVLIQGGMDELPGTSIIMPGQRTKNGVRLELVNGQMARDGFPLPPVPVIPPEGSPLAEKPGQPPHPVGETRATILPSMPRLALAVA
jgi:hypothetical protein